MYIVATVAHLSYCWTLVEICKRTHTYRHDDCNTSNLHWPVLGPVLLKAVRNRLDGTAWSRPDAARSHPDTGHNSTVERSERNKSHTNYMLNTCSVPSFCHTQDEHGKWENNVTSRYKETYTTIARCSTALQRHYNKFRAGLALIPLLTDPDGIRIAPDGSGRLLVGPTEIK